MKYYKHPAYIGYADQIPADDDRHPGFKADFHKQGFDDSCTWSLDDSLIRWLTPRLRRFYEISLEFHDAPELHKAIKKILKGFDLYLSEDYNEFDMKHIKQVDKSFKLLAKYYRALWW